MTQAEKRHRNQQIAMYFETNPMQESVMERYRRMSNRYKITQTQIYRILQSQKTIHNDKQCL